MRENFELVLSFFVVTFLTAVYIVYEIAATPSGGHLFGHFLGIFGALLMLMTETIYSARKRWGIFRFGQIRHWLSFHIFTGIVGPFLVLMHSGLEFRGLAGFTMFLTVIVVGSGFLGRYIYTAVPRTVAGVELDRRSLESLSEKLQQELAYWGMDKSDRVQSLIRQETGSSLTQDATPLEVLTGRFQEWRHRRKIEKAIKELDREERLKMAEIERLIGRQQTLERQIRSLQGVRKLMSWWHIMHVPLGLTLFAAMFIHIFATIYYGAL